MNFTSEVVYGIPVDAVVRNGFPAPYPSELIIKKQYVGLFNASYTVLDLNGNMFLQVDGCSRNCEKKRIIRDTAGIPILTMCKKAYTMHHRWSVHRGESLRRNDLLFSMQRSNVFRMDSRFDIFLANSISEDVSDFHIVRCNSSVSAKIYQGDSMIAEAKYSFKWGSLFGGRDHIRVRLYQNSDYAFVVALIVIHAESMC